MALQIRLEPRWIRHSAFALVIIVIAARLSSNRGALTAEALGERIDLPLLWTAQEKTVGIAS